MRKLTSIAFAAALSACGDPYPTVERGEHLQAKANLCPMDKDGNPTVGENHLGLTTVQCKDMNADGIVDKIVDFRSGYDAICTTAQGTEMCDEIASPSEK